MIFKKGGKEVFIFSKEATIVNILSHLTTIAVLFLGWWLSYTRNTPFLVIGFWICVIEIFIYSLALIGAFLDGRMEDLLPLHEDVLFAFLSPTFLYTPFGFLILSIFIH